jgi:hypothetical protein
MRNIFAFFVISEIVALMPRPSIPVIVRVTLAWGLLALE